jgi:NADH-quinone oxidoreductase subunit D
LYAFREREQILDLFEAVCGARLTYSYITIGGVHDDLPPDWTNRCRRFLEYFQPRIAEYHALLTRNEIFIRRTAGIGVISKYQALDYGCTGPVLRASLDGSQGDPAWDLRKTEPYSGYQEYDFDVPIPPLADRPHGAVIGDCWHRFAIRMREVEQSLRIVAQALDRYDALQKEWTEIRSEYEAKQDQLTAEERKAEVTRLEGLARTHYAHRVEPPRTLTPGECYVETEAPRGQMGFYVVGRPNKENVPLRVRARSGCFGNLSVIEELCRGALLGDMPAIIGSLDIVMGEIDR